MTNKKLTYKVAIDYILENCVLPDEIRTKVEELKKTVDRKRERKENTANREIAYKIYDKLPVGIEVYGGQLRGIIDETKDFTPQKLVAIMKILIDDKKVKKLKGDKGATCYIK